MARLASFIFRFRLPVLLLALVFMVIAALLVSRTLDSLTQAGFDNPESESSRAQQTLVSQLGIGGDDLLVLYHNPDLLANAPGFQGQVVSAVERLQQNDLVVSAISAYSTGDPSMVSKDGHYAIVRVSLRGSDAEKLDAFDDLSRIAQVEGMETTVGGKVALDSTIDEIADRDLRRAEMIALPLILLLMLYVFRSLVAAALPLAIGLLNIVTASMAVGALGKVTDVSSLALTPITMLGLGLAVDYALLIVSRYREEIKKSDVETAIARTLNTAGRTVVLAALIVSLSIVGLLLFPHMFLRSLGIGVVVTTITAAVWSLTVLPALLALIGTRIDALRLPFTRERATEGGSDRWDRFSGLVMRLAAPLAVVSGALLLLMATPSFGMKLHANDPHELPSDTASRQVYDVLNSEEFGSGTASPIIAAVKIADSLPPQDIPTATDSLIEDLTHLPRVSLEQIYLFPNPRSQAPAAPASGAPGDTGTAVPNLPGTPGAPAPSGDAGSVTFPDITGLSATPGETTAPSGLPGGPGVATTNDADAVPGASLAPVSPQQVPAGAPPIPTPGPGSTLMLTLRTESAPFSPEARQLVKSMRALEIPGLSLQVGGMSASYEDDRSTIFNTLPYLFAIIIGVVFLVMFVLLRSVLVPLKAILVGALSLTASYGFLVWGFQSAHLDGVFDFEGIGSIHITLPILLFPCIFALSMDYETFLLTRIREEFDRTDDNENSIRLGLQRAGRVITGAAIILIVVFAAFSTGSLLYIKEIGLTLAFAIAIDATIVRLVLVPATMKLVGRANWWSPVAARTFSPLPATAEQSSD